MSSTLLYSSHFYYPRAAGAGAGAAHTDTDATAVADATSPFSLPFAAAI
jgi:hypothetical protein